MIATASSKILRVDHRRGTVDLEANPAAHHTTDPRRTMKQFGRPFCIVTMAKLTRSHSKSALVEGDLSFTAGNGRFSIGLTSRETDTRYHLQLSEAEAQQFAAFIAERVEIDRYEAMR